MAGKGRPDLEQGRKAADRRKQVYELRLRNMSFRAIGEALHMHWRSVQRDFEKVFQQVPVSDIRQQRRIELERNEAIAQPLWNIFLSATATNDDKLGAANRLLKCMDIRARLQGLYAPQKVALDEEGGLTLTMMRTLLARKAEAEAILQQQQLETTAERRDESASDENNNQSGAEALTLEALRRAGNGSGPGR